MSKMAMAGLLSMPLPPPLDENVEALLYNLHYARIELSANLDRSGGGLFGLGSSYLYEQREKAILKYARLNHISLSNEHWRRIAIERIAFDKIDADCRKKKRGGQRRPRFGLLSPNVTKGELLERVTALQDEAAARGETLTDVDALRMMEAERRYRGAAPEVIAVSASAETFAATIKSRQVTLSRQRHRARTNKKRGPPRKKRS